MFLNGCISVKPSLINTKIGDFVNLGVLFLIMCPFQFEIRQWSLLVTVLNIAQNINFNTVNSVPPTVRQLHAFHENYFHCCFCS